MKTVVLMVSARLLVAALLRTSYVPDEYYQGPEPAYHFVFEGNKEQNTWEWQPEYRIRSYVGILPYIGVFMILQKAGLDFMPFTAITPRAAQAILSAVGDCCLLCLARSISGEDVARAVMWIHLLSWSTIYLWSRTLSNTTESALFVIGLCLYELSVNLKLNEDNKRDYWMRSVAFAIAALSIYIRPTAVLLWGPALIYHLYSCNRFKSDELAQAASIGTVTLAFCCIIDRICYGEWTLPPLNFFIQNVIRSISIKFGQKSVYWYFVEGYPMLLGLYLPPLVLGSFYFRAPKKIWWLLGLCAIYPIGLVIATSHQEARFLAPCLPLLHLALGHFYSQFIRKRTVAEYQIWKRLWYIVAAANVGFSIFLCRYHQFGVESAASFVSLDMRSIRSNLTTSPPQFAVFILAPCFSFPGRSFFAPGHSHHSKQLQAVDVFSVQCSPYDDNSPPSNPLEISRFGLRSLQSLTHGYEACYIVTFDGYMSALHNVTETFGFAKVGKWRHAYFRYDFDDPIFNEYSVVFKALECGDVPRIQ